MPKFAANLSFLFTEAPFPERFKRAAAAGFKGVEYLFPYEHAASDIADWLRTNDLEEPHPEELHRTLVTPMASLHFAPTRLAASALRREGVDASRIHVTGNTGIDALCDTIARLDAGPELAASIERAYPQLVSTRRPLLLGRDRRTRRRRGLFGARRDRRAELFASGRRRSGIRPGIRRAGAGLRQRRIGRRVRPAPGGRLRVTGRGNGRRGRQLRRFPANGRNLRRRCLRQDAGPMPLRGGRLHGADRGEKRQGDLPGPLHAPETHEQGPRSLAVDQIALRKPHAAGRSRGTH